ncbi:hypothetical protein GCM10011578_084690 [Streptomyces fuscichromogenes]|uniref:DUF1330 domain-containing protein n=1 Tax=Streptomyces fuscichromogenes TaxID=1324013 RepID=A0A917XN19_9ACTN|nr:hypothetical protein GCM10011578_084690 [Streptomyces fuscichromogenes]
MTPLVGYGAIDTLEGAPFDGALIHRFPNVADARAWYGRPAHQAAQPDIGLSGSRVVRCDVAAVQRRQRISRDPGVPPVRPVLRPKELDQCQDSGRHELLLAVRRLDLGLLVR